MLFLACPLSWWRGLEEKPPRLFDLACRSNGFNLRAGRLESRLSSVDCYNGVKQIDCCGVNQRCGTVFRGLLQWRGTESLLFIVITMWSRLLLWIVKRCGADNLLWIVTTIWSRQSSVDCYNGLKQIFCGLLQRCDRRRTVQKPTATYWMYQ